METILVRAEQIADRVSGGKVTNRFAKNINIVISAKNTKSTKVRITGLNRILI